MSWSVGDSYRDKRHIGYGVPCFCEHPGCQVVIDRGLSHVCGDMHDESEHGCGSYFCPEHMAVHEFEDGHIGDACEACRAGAERFPLKPDHPEWADWVLKDESWAKWREDNPERMAEFKRIREEG